MELEENRLEANFLFEISEDVFCDIFSEFLSGISVDVFTCSITTSFVSNRRWREAAWLGPTLGLPRTREQVEAHTNHAEEESEEEDTEEEDSEEEEEEEADLASVLHSWDWPQQLLWAAARRGHAEEAAEALRSGAEVGRIDAEGRTALLLAVRGGCHATVEVLLRAGAGVGAQGGEAPVEAAARRGDQVLVDRLLGEVGGDLYALVK